MVAEDSSVYGAVCRDLERIREVDEELAESALAMTALALATAIDSPDSTTSLSMCSRALNETLGLLRELVPPQEKVDNVTKLSDRAALKLRRAAS